MTQSFLVKTAPEEVVLTFLKHLKEGLIDQATACFAERFSFSDHGLHLEFKDKNRLEEFFRKTRELYPQSSLDTGTLLVSGNYIVTEWTLHTTVKEPWFGGHSREVCVSLDGVSIVQTENGKIRQWSDYYDGLISRRAALASHFTDWIEL